MEQKKWRGMLWMLGFCVCYTLLTTSIKYFGKDVPKPMMMLCRTLFVLCFTLPVALQKGIQKPTVDMLRWYALRGVLGYGAMYATYYTLGHLPLATAAAIGYTEPVMQLGLAFVFLGTVITFEQLLLVTLAYIGVVVMNHPISEGSLYYIIIALLANLLAAMARVITKHISVTEPPHQNMLYGNIFLLFMTMVWVACSGGDTSLTNTHLMGLLGIGFLAFLGQYCYMHAVQLADLHVLNPLMYLRIIFSLPLGIYLFGETIGLLTCLGGAVVLVANYLLTRTHA